MNVLLVSHLTKTVVSACGLARLLTAVALLFLLMTREVNSSVHHSVLQALSPSMPTLQTAGSTSSASMEREQGCPLGEVFNAGTGSGEDGQCTDPELVPECANYYAGSNDVELRKFEERQSSNPSRLRTGRKL